MFLGSLNDESSEEYVTYQVSQLTVSPENTLFHYVHLEVADGIYLSTLNGKRNDDSLHPELLDSFRSACQIIHQTFETSLRSREAFKAPTSESRPWTNRSLVAVKEQGILCHWSPRPKVPGGKAMPLLSYWVCGRLFVVPHLRESYVCYHESAPQNLIELAFRLTHGIQL